MFIYIYQQFSAVAGTGIWEVIGSILSLLFLLILLYYFRRRTARKVQPLESEQIHQTIPNTVVLPTIEFESTVFNDNNNNFNSLASPSGVVNTDCVLAMNLSDVPDTWLSKSFIEANHSSGYVSDGLSVISSIHLASDSVSSCDFDLSTDGNNQD